jgi:hypothetical protein
LRPLNWGVRENRQYLKLQLTKKRTSTTSTLFDDEVGEMMADVDWLDLGARGLSPQHKKRET